MSAPATAHPSQSPLTRGEVEDAARALVNAFATTDTEAYFSSFHPTADFVFHTEPRRLPDRQSYRDLWDSWLADGWEVTACESTNATIHLLGDAAVFVHDVATLAGTPNTQESAAERETIVFARDEKGDVVAYHEHLSPAPANQDAHS